MRLAWLRCGLVAAACVAAALPAAAAGAPVSVGHSGWSWGNPTPQGNSLTAIEFAGARGYAVGNFGTVLRTDDAGDTWTGLNPGITADFRHISLIGPDSFVIAAGCAVRRSDDGGRTFARLPWTATDASCTSPVRAVDFPSPDTGYLLLANGNMFRSTDGGRSWTRRTAVPLTRAVDPSSTAQPLDLAFTSPTRGFAVIHFGQIFRTTDGGSTWSPVAAAPFGHTALAFPSASVGYAGGDNGQLWKTTDGGDHWAPHGDTGTNATITALRCANTNVCVASVLGGSELLVSSDGGSTWTHVSPSTRALFAASFANPSRLVAVGLGGATVVSNDGGQTFSANGGALPGTFDFLRAASPAVAYAFGQGGALARTTDGGASWQEIDAPTSDEVVDVSFPTVQTGFALDSVGQLLRTTNSGDSWEILNTGARITPVSALAVGANRVLLAGPGGLRLSTNAGQSFTAVHEKGVTKARLFELEPVSNRVVIAFGDRDIVRSTDGGLHFRPLHRPFGKRSKRKLLSVDFVSAKVGYAVDDSGRVSRTTDGGRHWPDVPGVGTETGYTLDFSDRNHGWIAVDQFGDDASGYVLRTSNGGRTWAPQLLDANFVKDLGLAATGRDSGFALTSGNHLVSTSTGGFRGGPSSLRIKPRHASMNKAGIVRIDGRLTPRAGGEPVVVSVRTDGSHDWLFTTTEAATNGTFTVFAHINRSADFVAQWAGDDTRNGAGSRVVRVVVRHPARRGARRAGVKIAATRAGL